MKIRGMVALMALATGLACSDNNGMPLPHGHMRIGVPMDSVVTLSNDPLQQRPFAFKHNASAHWEARKESGWGDLVYPDLHARIEFTYKPVNGQLLRLIDDAFALAYKHNIVADGMTQHVYSHPEVAVHGLLFAIQGNSASATQCLLNLFWYPLFAVIHLFVHRKLRASCCFSNRGLHIDLAIHLHLDLFWIWSHYHYSKLLKIILLFCH